MGDFLELSIMFFLFFPSIMIVIFMALRKWWRRPWFLDMCCRDLDWHIPKYRGMSMKVYCENCGRILKND